MIKLNRRDYITIIISIVIALTPLFFELCLCLFIRYQIKKDMNRDNQNYIADCSEFGYYIRISEEGKQRDSLRFSFRKHSGELVCDDLLIRNSSWDVVSFVFVEGVDSVYIRDFPHRYERFSPEEKEKYINEPEGYKEEVSIIGALPPICRIISYSDPLFFVYDRDYYSSYKPKSNNIHFISLWHDIERTDTYILLETTKDSTRNVELKVLKKE